MPAATIISVGPAGSGAWRVSTEDDRLGGWFLSHKAALAFAREEARMSRLEVVVRAADPDRTDS